MFYYQGSNQFLLCFKHLDEIKKCTLNGFIIDSIIDIFGPKGVLLLGADNWAVEYVQFPTALSFPVHVHWIICNGGFLFENMRLDHWVTDARNGSVPYQGGFYLAHTKIKGAVGGMGTPIAV